MGVRRLDHVTLGGPAPKPQATQSAKSVFAVHVFAESMCKPAFDLFICQTKLVCYWGVWTFGLTP